MGWGRIFPPKNLKIINLTQGLEPSTYESTVEPSTDETTEEPSTDESTEEPSTDKSTESPTHTSPSVKVLRNTTTSNPPITTTRSFANHRQTLCYFYIFKLQGEVVSMDLQKIQQQVKIFHNEFCEFFLSPIF